ncbi:MAG: PQQ-dependent sugar dehydrogenase [Deltaproteobacteria bacterium]|nr:PQQ-dependent sugar dehydrogenase [Deltaproteobacteria bacterium]
MHLIIFSFIIITMAVPAAATDFPIEGTKGTVLAAKRVATFDEPWAMTFLPDDTLLVTEKRGVLWHVTSDGSKNEVQGLWKVAYGGQGGLGDVVLHPDFEHNSWVYLSYAERGNDNTAIGAVVVRAKLNLKNHPLKFTSKERLWAQEPKVTGKGHYSHRIAFGPDGKMFITSGDRQKLTPAQNFDGHLGKLLRLNDDGTVPTDNPWQNRGEIAKQFWTVGHRNMLGIDFDADERLWVHEMGPCHGDELNLIIAGKNYGWPIVSNGDHYSGVPIPDHDTRPEFEAPRAFWVPSIAPSGLVIYDGGMFTGWKGSALIGGLVSRALIQVDIKGETAKEVERFKWGERIREVEQGPEGALYVLEDGSGGRLLKLTPGQ